MLKALYSRFPQQKRILMVIRFPRFPVLILNERKMRLGNSLLFFFCLHIPRKFLFKKKKQKVNPSQLKPLITSKTQKKCKKIKKKIGGTRL